MRLPWVIHAVSISQKNIKEAFPNSEIKKLCLNDSRLSSLIDFIINSFAKNELGEIIALQKGIYGDSQFYLAEGKYHLLNTCNKWTAKGLKQAGFDVNPTFKLTASSVMNAISDSSSCSDVD